jgi:transposase-like protein
VQEIRHGFRRSDAAGHAQETSGISTRCISGFSVQHYLWRAVDQEGVVLDILVQPRRDSNAAKRFFKRLLKGLEYVPRVIVTDKLRSYGVAQASTASRSRASEKPISE